MNRLGVNFVNTFQNHRVDAPARTVFAAEDRVLNLKFERARGGVMLVDKNRTLAGGIDGARAGTHISGALGLNDDAVFAGRWICTNRIALASDIFRCIEGDFKLVMWVSCSGPSVD